MRDTSRIGEGNCGAQKKVTKRKHQAKLQQKNINIESNY